MKKDELILKTREILESRNDDIIIEECIDLIENLAKIASMHNPNEVYNAFEDFFNYETLNYVSDAKLNKSLLKKWSKESILDWLEKQEIASSLERMYNENALVIAMNYEYTVHKNYVESTENQAMTAYLLAKEALEQENYINDILHKNK